MIFGPRRWAAEWAGGVKQETIIRNGYSEQNNNGLMIGDLFGASRVCSASLVGARLIKL